MAHNNHTTSNVNSDLVSRSRAGWLRLTENWEDPYPVPHVQIHQGVVVIRDDKITGSKCRFADLLLSRVKERVLVYVQPRVGLAGLSIIEVAKRYHKQVVLFMPASQRISDHQAACIEKGAIPKFKRIAAMPVLNSYAKKWAEENGAYFIPLGLRHELATACGVRVVDTIQKAYGTPKHVWSAISTGVLSRALQIGWPRSEHTVVAVSRNLKPGEVGKANIISEPLPFSKAEHFKNLPPFPSVSTYDAKVWKYIPRYSGHWMWNVGADPEMPLESTYNAVNSYREWGE